MNFQDYYNEAYIIIYNFQQQMQKSDLTSLPKSGVTIAQSQISQRDLSVRLQQKNISHSQIMMRISRELMEVMQATYQSDQKNKVLQQLQRIKKQYETQIHSLKLKQHLQQSTYNFNIQQHKNKYDQVLHERDCLHFENQKLKLEIIKNRKQMEKLSNLNHKYEVKIKNQEALIDQYKTSIQQQINLQKQVIKASYTQKQFNMKIQFQKALKSMQENYQRKISQLKYQSACKDFKNDVRTVKKFCDTLGKKRNKQNLADAFGHENNENINIYDTNMKKMNGASSYSTLAK